MGRRQQANETVMLTSLTPERAPLSSKPSNAIPSAATANAAGSRSLIFFSAFTGSSLARSGLPGEMRQGPHEILAYHRTIVTEPFRTRFPSNHSRLCRKNRSARGNDLRCFFNFHHFRASGSAGWAAWLVASVSGPWKILGGGGKRKQLTPVV